MTDYVFVYGSLKKGGFNHSLLDGATYIADRVIDGTALISLGAFPGLVITGSDTGVHGEIYRINSRILDRLDKLESEGYLYKRVKMRVEEDAIDCWVYVYMLRIPVKNLVPGGKWDVGV